MILPMEHRTPSGLEIKMYAKEAKRLFGIKLNKDERDETEEELKARFARVLAETDFDAIARVYQLKEPPAPKASPVVRARASKKAPAQPTLQLTTEQAAIPSFLTRK